MRRTADDDLVLRISPATAGQHCVGIDFARSLPAGRMTTEWDALLVTAPA
jgi:hypothetical protein